MNSVAGATAAAKAQLRQEVQEVLRTIPAERVRELSRHACERLARQPVWRQAASVFGFAPMAGELDIWPLIEAAWEMGKEVALPQFDPAIRAYRVCRVRGAADLVLGHFGIREPAPDCPPAELKRLDLVLVPGVAFDSRGRRLGRGKGYYDRMLPATRGVLCGVAFDEQVVGEVPAAPHDASVSCILTPTRWIEAV